MADTKVNNGGPAFPTLHSEGENVALGMSLRDYFAAKAMQSLIIGGISPTIRAFAAYKEADAMLAERDK